MRPESTLTKFRKRGGLACSQLPLVLQEQRHEGEELYLVYALLPNARPAADDKMTSYDVYTIQFFIIIYIYIYLYINI